MKEIKTILGTVSMSTPKVVNIIDAKGDSFWVNLDTEKGVVNDKLTEGKMVYLSYFTIPDTRQYRVTNVQLYEKT